MIDVLNEMALIMKELNIKYDYLELKSKLSYPYVIGEYYENEYIDEERKTIGEFLLTLWDRNLSSVDIIKLNQKIKDRLRDYKVIKNGNAIQFSYSNALPVLQEADNLKKQEIRIDVVYYEK